MLNAPAEVAACSCTGLDADTSGWPTHSDNRSSERCVVISDLVSVPVKPQCLWSKSEFATWPAFVSALVLVLLSVSMSVINPWVVVKQAPAESA